MLCYKDKCFCPYWKECADGNECDRKLTDEVRNDAKKSTLSISQFVSKPDCFVKTEKREILFRGKTYDGKWYEGNLDIRDFDERKYYIRPYKSLVSYEVIPETVGQFIGLKDKDGVKIFEGDYLITNNKDLWAKSVREIKYLDKWASFFAVDCLDKNQFNDALDSDITSDCKVAGNAHDNDKYSDKKWFTLSL